MYFRRYHGQNVHRPASRAGPVDGMSPFCRIFCRERTWGGELTKS